MLQSRRSGRKAVRRPARPSCKGREAAAGERAAPRRPSRSPAVKRRKQQVGTKNVCSQRPVAPGPSRLTGSTSFVMAGKAVMVTVERVSIVSSSVRMVEATAARWTEP
jgi:hypothetical protein